MFFDIMCDEAAKLVSSVLCKGNLVKNVTIYGVVVAPQPQVSTIVKAFKGVESVHHFKF